MATNGTSPNILFVLADDMGAWAMGCAGNREVRTPHLDALAAQGMRFENFFCVSPVCSAARASILTGRIPSQHGVHDWIREGNSVSQKKEDGSPGEAIPYLDGLDAYTDHLAAGGYRCALSGKWHLGDSDHPQKGFSHWYVLPRNGGEYQNPLFFNGKEFAREEGYLTDLITDHALDYLRGWRETQAGSPFYLSVHYFSPHAPWWRRVHPETTFDQYMTDCPLESAPRDPIHPWMHNLPGKTGMVYPEKTYPRDEQERRERLSGYYTAITEMDRNIGRLIAFLDEYGLRDNTLVVFTSDNGMNLGHHGIYGKGNGTFPQNMYDTSVKVPMIMCQPGKLPSGTTVNGLFSHYDLMPTLLEYAGLSSPRHADLPGTSFAPLLHGNGQTDDGSPAGCEQIVVFDEYGPVRMIRTTEWKYVHRYPYGPHELYDLKNDPDERYNLITASGMDDRIHELKARLEQWFCTYVDPERDGIREPVVGDGQIALCGLRSEGRPAFLSGPDIHPAGTRLALHQFP